MGQLTFLWEELPVSPSVSPDCVVDSKTIAETSHSPTVEFFRSLDPDGLSGKTSLVSCHRTKDGTLAPSSGRWKNSGMGSLTEFSTLNTLEYPSDVVESSLLDVLETGDVPQKFFLSQVACAGILRKAAKRGKILPEALRLALQQAVDSEPTSI